MHTKLLNQTFCYSKWGWCYSKVIQSFPHHQTLCYFKWVPRGAQVTQFSPMIEHKNVPSIDRWWKFWTLIVYIKCSSIGHLLNIDWFNHWSIIGPWSNYWHDRSSIIVWWWTYICYLLFGYFHNNFDIAQKRKLE